jgi:hypothetical protein
MFSASVCALVLFMVPLFGWRFFNNIMCAAKLRQIRRGQVCPLICADLAMTVTPLLVVIFAVGGVAALCGAIAWVAGAVFWLFYH